MTSMQANTDQGHLPLDDLRAAALTDLSSANTLHKRALALNEEDARTAGILNSIGDTFWERYEAEYYDNDLERALLSYDRSVRLTPDLDQEQGTRLANLGLALWTRFENTGQVSDIDRACLCFERSLVNEPTGGRARDRMANLGGALLGRFLRLDEINDVARAIAVLQQAVDAIAEDDPGKALLLTNLGAALQSRFERLGDITDLESSVSARQKAVNLTPEGHLSAAARWNNLGIALKARFDRLGDLSDLEAATAAQQKAVDLTPDGHPNKPTCWDNLGAALESRFDRLGNLSDLEATIDAKRRAVDLTPDEHPDKARYLDNLGNALQSQFERLGDVSHLEAAISFQRQSVDLTSDDYPSKPTRLNNLAIAFMSRFEHLGDIADLAASIEAYQKAVKLIPDGHPDKPAILHNLSSVLRLRFNRLGVMEDSDAAVAAIQDAVDLTPDGHPSKPPRWNNLGLALQTRFEAVGDVLDLEAAITAQRRAIELFPDGHPRKPAAWSVLGAALEARFKNNGEIPDLEATVAARKRVVDLTPDEHPSKPMYLNNLGSALATRFERLGNSSDLSAAIDAVSTAAQSKIGAPQITLKAARQWCGLSEKANDREQTLQAYNRALSLISRVAWMGLAIEDRYWHLEQVGGLVRNAAAAAVRYGKYDRALEWLEQGRSVVWGQTLQLRSSYDLLRERDPIRAERLTSISHAFQENAKDAESSPVINGDNLRSLSFEWDKLVSEVRQQDGLEDFLGPKKVAQLLPAASLHPVVVLNAHTAGCDALVLRVEGGGVMHIPLKLTNERAQLLLDTLEDVQPRQSIGEEFVPDDRGFRFPSHNKADSDAKIKDLLAELWESIAKPVLDGLAFSPHEKDDDLPRICWCPTGSLAFLPIHAAGLYNTNDRGTKVSDFVVSSYTPTVSALIQAAPSPATRPRLFAVAQTQAAQGSSPLPSTKRELDLLIGRASTSAAVDLVIARDGDGTVKYVLEEMTRCHWVHLACHGTQNLINPTHSAFILADGNLELAEIIKHPLPHADFAFLSACQTASGSVKLAEEAVHLAAGMMLAGYRGVIATMWSMQDRDGPMMADAVYAEMLKGGKADVSRAAHGLHKAVQQLRRSGAPFWAWMPFIHMGI